MLDLLPVLMFASLFTLVAAERLFPGRPLPTVARWGLKGVAFFAMSFFLGAVLPELWAPWMAQHALVDLSGLGIGGGFVVVLLLTDLASYVWHRTTHHVPWIWRWTHQMHHSAERVDVAGAFYFHPLDILAYALLASAAGALLGVVPEAAGLASFVMFVLSIFQHANVRTPRWVGWFVQRPEAHALHHTRGVHAFNYGNLALFDQLFGTYRNPASYGDQKAGYWDGASSSVLAMLLGRDVGTPDAVAPPAESESQAAPAE